MSETLTGGDLFQHENLAFCKCLRQYNWRLVGSKGIALTMAWAFRGSRKIRSGFELGIIGISVNLRLFIVYDSR